MIYFRQFSYAVFQTSLETDVIAVKVSADACEMHVSTPLKVSIADPMTIGFGFYDN